uniref:Uncharacterized protein n=1 Tax=Anopheles atroparvus TaxID=41427 RepID=A0AAG5D4E2_ANOAO
MLHASLLCNRLHAAGYEHSRVSVRIAHRLASKMLLYEQMPCNYSLHGNQSKTTLCHATVYCTENNEKHYSPF